MMHLPFVHEHGTSRDGDTSVVQLEPHGSGTALEWAGAEDTALHPTLQQGMCVHMKPCCSNDQTHRVPTMDLKSKVSNTGFDLVKNMTGSFLFDGGELELGLSERGASLPLPLLPLLVLARRLQARPAEPARPLRNVLPLFNGCGLQMMQQQQQQQRGDCRPLRP